MNASIDNASAERFILLIEDTSEHVSLIETVLKDSPIRNRIEAVHELEAMNFLHLRGSYADAARPDLILLNLKLCEKNSSNILAEIKADPQLKRIPIIVLSHSDSADDIANTYALQGNAYVLKSSELDRLAEAIQRIEAFWLRIVTLPLR
jgi:two-component system, chemotaxis family, response regulator Rcp1